MASSWRALGAVAPVQYRRHEVWPMAWSSSDEGDDTGAADASSAAGPLHTSVVVGAAFGGPIATMCNPRLMVSVRGAPPTTGKAGTIELHSSSGVHMRSLPLTEEWRSQTVVKMGWTMEERLVVVFASGLALMFSVHSAEVVAQFNVVPQGSAELQDVVIWPHGLVAMTSAFQLVYVSNLDYYAAQAMARASIVEGAEAAQAAATEGSRDLPTLVLPSLRFTGSATPTSIAVVQSPQGDEVRDARIAKGKPPPIRVLVATSDCTVLFVDCAGCEDKELREQLTEGGPINMMVLTPNGKYIACFSANGVLSVWSSDFATRVMENPIKTTQAPRQIVWCGGDSVILHWVPVGLLMVGPSAECVAASSPAVGAALLVLRCWGAALLGRCWRRPMRRCCPGASAAHRLTASPRPVCAPRPAPRALRSRRARYLKYSFDRQPLHLVQELDCVRVISNSACVILQRVPPEIEQIRGLGSTVPAAMLFDAHDAFVAGEARADDSIRAVAGDADATVLPRAIETCLAAALAEFSLRAQTELLNAGAFGKCFLEDGDSLNVESRRIADVLRATAMKLRLLHTLRRPDIAMPLTSAQLAHLSVRGIIVRLATVRNHHMLSLKLCTFFWRLARDKACVRAVASCRRCVRWACTCNRRARACRACPFFDFVFHLPPLLFHSPLPPFFSPSRYATAKREVLIDWAAKKIRSVTSKTITDSKLCSLITAKLSSVSDVPYADITRIADGVGRRKLALMLLEHEPALVKQVRSSILFFARILLFLILFLLITTNLLRR